MWEQEQNQRNFNNQPLVSKNLFMGLFMMDAWKIIKLGKDQSYSFKELFKQPEKFTQQSSAEELSESLLQTKNLSVMSLLWLIRRSTVPLLLFCVITYGLTTMVPFVTQELLDWLGKDGGNFQGFSLVFVIIMGTLLRAVLSSHYVQYLHITIADAKNILGSCILPRINDLNNKNKLRNVDLGKLTIVLNSDIDKVSFCVGFLLLNLGHYIALIPVFIYLLNLIGFWTVLLLGITLTVIGIQELLGSRYQGIDQERREEVYLTKEREFSLI